MRKATLEKPATERQRSILDVIRSFTSERGYPPSVREIGERVGLSSSSTIHAHLKALERRGLISRDPTSPAQCVRVRPSRGTMPSSCPFWDASPPGCLSRRRRTEGEFLLSAGFVPRVSDAFMLRVQGDSMVEAAILDGDLIVVRPQRSAENGEIVVAMLDGEATVKRFYREPGRIRLQPENRAMAPIYASDVEIVGRVEAVVRRL